MNDKPTKPSRDSFDAAELEKLSLPIRWIADRLLTASGAPHFTSLGKEQLADAAAAERYLATTLNHLRTQDAWMRAHCPTTKSASQALEGLERGFTRTAELSTNAFQQHLAEAGRGAVREAVGALDSIWPPEVGEGKSLEEVFGTEPEVMPAHTDTRPKLERMKEQEQVGSLYEQMSLPMRRVAERLRTKAEAMEGEEVMATGTPLLAFMKKLAETDKWMARHCKTLPAAKKKLRELQQEFGAEVAGIDPIKAELAKEGVATLATVIEQLEKWPPPQPTRRQL